MISTEMINVEKKQCDHEFSIIEINHFTSEIHGIQCLNLNIDLINIPKKFSIIILKCKICDRNHMNITNKFNLDY